MNFHNALCPTSRWIPLDSRRKVRYDSVIVSKGAAVGYRGALAFFRLSRGGIALSIHEECGIFGVWDPAGDCARTVYYGLFALQHRGQEACGIAAVTHRELSCHKDVGLVGEVFSPALLNRLGGTMAMGHVRYSTTGGARRENAQPLTLNYVKGTLAVAHNGNLVNTSQLRTAFEYRGAIFQTTTDSELIAYAIAQKRLHCASAEEAVCQAMGELKGAYSLLVMSPQKLIAGRGTKDYYLRGTFTRFHKDFADRGHSKPEGNHFFVFLPIVGYSPSRSTQSEARPKYYGEAIPRLNPIHGLVERVNRLAVGNVQAYIQHSLPKELAILPLLYGLLLRSD